jgi:Ca2+-binding EF-hand superfamily protein
MKAPVLVLTAFLSTTLASAAEPEPQTQEEVDQVFESLDRDEDERISKSEAQRKAELRERFAGVDASGDGYLSRSEYRSRPTDEPFE